LLMSVIKGFRKRMVAVMVSINLICVGYALVALTPTGLFWFMAIGGMIMAFCLPIANVSIQTIRQTVVPMKMQGRVTSVVGALATAATPFGMILSGTIVEFTRTSNLFLGCAGLGILISTVSWFLTDIRYVEEMDQRESKTQMTDENIEKDN